MFCLLIIMDLCRMFEGIKKNQNIEQTPVQQSEVSWKSLDFSFHKCPLCIFLSEGSYSHQVSSQCKPATHADVPESDSPEPCPAAGPEGLLQARDVSLQLWHGQSRQLPTGMDSHQAWLNAPSSALHSLISYILFSLCICATETVQTLLFLVILILQLQKSVTVQWVGESPQHALVINLQPRFQISRDAV